MRFSTKCPEMNCLQNKIQRLNAAVKYSLFCSWQLNHSKTQLTEHLFYKFIKETTFTPKSVSRIKRNGAQNVHHENEQPTIVVWTTVQYNNWLALDWSRPSNCSWLASDDQRPQSSDDIPAAAEPPKYRVVHGIQIRWVCGQLGGSIKSGTFVWFSVVKGAIITVDTQVTSLMTCGYFRSINKEYISTRQLFFINRLTAISAAYFDANVTILQFIL